MAGVPKPILLIPAVAGLLALPQTAGDATFSADTHFASEARGFIQMPANVEVARAPDGSPILLRVGAPQDEQSREAVPLTCLQIQVIDELELISEPTPEADCD